MMLSDNALLRATVYFPKEERFLTSPWTVSWNKCRSFSTVAKLGELENNGFYCTTLMRASAVPSSREFKMNAR
ncbi:hypothetical protein M513_03212 [Trichuris suis]|uniref:Uncharacterized protein n=1 Tax=Trichuris suis TaxID=68888 RepID=A0A085MEX7_9BILA|nr:hypothetical protein M513_03212 [Trichuris suis]